MAIPLLAVPIVEGALQLLGGAAAYSVANNYIHDNPKTSSGSSAPTIPMSKGSKSRPSPKIAKKQALGKMSEGIVAGLGVVAGLIGSSVTNMSSSAQSISSTNSTETEAKKAEHLEAPLLFNQVALQNSINGIVDSINSNTIVTASVLGTLDANLSSISSTLIAISSTLLEISENYSQEIDNTGDLPYVDSETFYEMLLRGGASYSEVDKWRFDEEALVQSLSTNGASFPEIKQAVIDFRNNNIPSSNLIKANSKVAGISSPAYNPSSSDGYRSGITKSPDYTKQLDTIADSAIATKLLHEFKMNSMPITDLDGSPVATMSPAQAEAIHHITNARHKTDTNNEEFDESMFPSLTMPILPFVGSTEIYNPNYTSPTTNPFTHKNL